MNFRHLRRLSAVALVLSTIPLSQIAAAQPGDGLKSSGGEWKLTPSLTLSGGYDSNVFRTGDGEQLASPTIDAPVGFVAPALAISNPGARNFQLELEAALQWEQYFGSDVVTQQGGVINPAEQSGLSARADVRGILNPKGDLSLTLDENFTRTNEPSNFSGNTTYNWIANRAGATVGIHPGARILEVDLGYHWFTYAYQSTGLDKLDRDEHRFDFAAKWRFLPKTALLVEADYGLVRWANSADPGSSPESGAPPLPISDSSPLRVQGGLSGLLTRRIAVRAVAGYGWSMDEIDPSFDGVIGTAALAYTFGRLDLENKLELGYSRNFRTSNLGNYYTSHAMFADIDAGILDRLVSFHLGGQFILRDYALSIDDPNYAALGSSPNDELLVGTAGIQTNIDDWLIFDLEYNLRANFTDDSYSVPVADGPELDYVREYTQHIITLGATVQY